MNLRLTRRQLGQLAIASTATAAITTLATKTFAQLQNLVICGVNSGTILSSNTATITEVDSTELDSTTPTITTPTITNLGIVLQSLNVVSGQVQNLTSPQVLQDRTTSILQVGDQITGFTALADGTFVLAITPIASGKKGAAPTRLIFLGKSATSVTVSGLQKQEQLESLLALKDGSLIGLVIRRNGRPPVRLVDVNRQTGEISSRITLPTNERYSNLAQCPDGKLYTTSVGREGDTYLVQLDLAQRNLAQNKPIQLRLSGSVGNNTFRGNVWNNGLSSLVCSSAGQLLALGSPWHDTAKYLYTVNASTGEMTLVTTFNVAKMTICPV